MKFNKRAFSEFFRRVEAGLIYAAAFEVEQGRLRIYVTPKQKPDKYKTASEAIGGLADGLTDIKPGFDEEQWSFFCEEFKSAKQKDKKFKKGHSQLLREIDACFDLLAERTVSAISVERLNVKRLRFIVRSLTGDATCEALRSIFPGLERPEAERVESFCLPSTVPKKSPLPRA